MTTFTFDTGNVEAGGLIIGIENFGEGLGLSDTNYEFLFIECEIDENIENDANELQITQATFKALNRDNVFKDTILKAAGSIVDARVYVKLTNGGSTEQCFYGIISPKVKYSENNRIVEFTAYSLIDEMTLITIDDIYAYLDGSIHLGRTSSDYSAGATVINYTLPRQKKGIDVGEIVRFAAAGTEYTVTAKGTNQITITPGLSTNYSSGTYITTKDYQIHVGANYYVKIDDVIKAVSRLIGCTSHAVYLERIRYYSDASNYYDFDDLVIRFWNGGGFFDSSTKPAESFYTFEGNDEALGVIRAICKGLGLFCDCRSTSPANDLKSYLMFYHKNAPTPPNNTMAMNNRKVIEEDYNWDHVFNEFTVTYPGGTDGPTILVPLHRTLQNELNETNMFALSGLYEILIYDAGTSPYIFTAHHVDYKLAPEGTWNNAEERGAVATRAMRMLLMDLYDDLKEVKNEVYKTVCGTLSSTDRFAYLRLSDYLTENNKYGQSRKYHFTRITRNFMKNETKCKRVEE